MCPAQLLKDAFVFVDGFRAEDVISQALHGARFDICTNKVIKDEEARVANPKGFGKNGTYSLSGA